MVARFRPAGGPHGLFLTSELSFDPNGRRFAVRQPRRIMSIMAKKEVVTITDDLDGRDGAETVTFAYDGRRYEIDLGEKNKAKLEKALAPFIAAARKAGRDSQGARRAAPGPATRNRGKALDLDAVRTWASAQGL